MDTPAAVRIGEEYMLSELDVALADAGTIAGFMGRSMLLVAPRWFLVAAFRREDVRHRMLGMAFLEEELGCMQSVARELGYTMRFELKGGMPHLVEWGYVSH